MQNGRQTWCSKIRLLLCGYGFNIIWQNQGVGNTRVFMSEFIQIFKYCYLQEWNDNVTSNRKLDVNRNIKNTVKLEPYINCIRERKKAKFRTSSHKLAIETGRHGQSQPRAERIRLFCKNNLDVTVIEDACHFLISCPAYTNIRNYYIKHILDKFNVNNELKMYNMLKTRNENWIKDMFLSVSSHTK